MRFGSHALIGCVAAVAGLLAVGCGPASDNGADRLAKNTQGLALAGGEPGKPFPIVGSFFNFTIKPIAVRQADGNSVIDFNFDEQLSGDATGTRTGTGTVVIHPDGTFNLKDTGRFTGTVTGIPGTVNLEAWASGTFQSFTGSVTIYASSGTGELTGLQGVAKISGAATGPATLAGSYDGQVHF
jgi:hypothetical protein